ncbi:MAG: hypothetical protein GW858_14605 [Sphingomonadales bacterium]|nr:hypothetical protein [Sphingomonadales bacterium]NCQ20797.1 hypothetical protein [Sphingomonadales bacterium]NCT02554.1 hypothetical protein [Sphingomonadales bacterium]
MSDLPLPDIFMDRVHDLAGKTPDLIAEVRFFPSSEGGRNGPVLNGYGCPCILHREAREGNDARFLFEQNWVEPGETVTAKLCFTFGLEAANRFRQVGRFYLWEDKIVGEAAVI